MTNYIQEGEVLEAVAPSGGVVSGTAYLFGVMVGVACVSAAVGESFSLALEGVFELPKATGQAWSLGAKLYWDDTAKNFTTTSSGNTAAGNVAKAALSGDTTGQVRLARF